MILKNAIYEEKTVLDYCRRYNIDFNDFQNRFNRMRKNEKAKKFSDEELIEYIFKNFYKTKKRQQSRRKYYINGKSVYEFAKDNRLIANSVRNAIINGLKANPDANIEEIAISFANNAKNRAKCEYIQYQLSMLCEEANISIDIVYKIFNEEYPNISDMTEEEINVAIKEIIDTLILSNEFEDEVLQLKKTL